MRPIELQTVISAPREDVFDFLSDLSRRVAWTDHFQKEFRLARVNPVGEGAAARFRIERPLSRQWVEISLVEADRPRRIVETGRYGRLGRSKLGAVYELTREGAATRVTLTLWTEPHSFDRVKESVGARAWLRRKVKRALTRLRDLLEEPPAEPLARTTVAGYEPLKHPRFGG